MLVCRNFVNITEFYFKMRMADIMELILQSWVPKRIEDARYLQFHIQP